MKHSYPRLNKQENLQETYCQTILKVERMQPHISQDRVVSWEEKTAIENMLNGHAAQMSRMLRLGQAHPY